MAYISSFTYCDGIQTEMTPQGPKPQIVKPLQVLTPIALPSNYSFAIACNIADFDVNIENSVRICFVSPSGKNVNDTDEIKFQIPHEQIKVNRPSVMQFNLDMRNVILREEGVYATRIFINGEQIGEYKIAVVVGELQ